MKTKTTQKAAMKSGQAAVSLPPTNQPFDICRDTLKVKWSYSRFGGDVHSDTVAADAAIASHAEKDSIIGKVMLIKRSDTAEINCIFRNAAVALRCRSLPWEDGGWRLMKSAEFAKVELLFAEFNRQVTDAVEGLCRRHSELKADCIKRLGNLEAGMFPTSDELRNKFGLRMFFDVIAKNQDIRLSGVSQHELEIICSKREQQIRQQLSEAQKDLILRIVESVKALRNRMEEMQQTKPEKNGKKAKNTSFKKDKETGKYPIFSNVEDMLKIAEELNFSNDPKISEVVRKVRDQFASVNPEVVKTSKLAQEKVLASTKTILDELAAF